MRHLTIVALSLALLSGCGISDDGTSTETPECTLREHGIELPLETEEMYGVWLMKSETVDYGGGSSYDSWTTEGVGSSKVPFWVEKSTLFLGDPALSNGPMTYANPVLIDEFTIRFNNSESDEFTAYNCPDELTDIFIPN